MIVALIAVLALFAPPQQAPTSGQPQMQTPPRPQPRDPATEKKGTASIKGRVVTADGGKPLRRVQIAISSPELPEPRSISTNSQGGFEVRELPAGRYNVSASRAGFLRLQYGQRRPGEAGRPLQLADGQTLDRIDFALPRMSVITGRVTDEIGEPLAGVTVFPMQTRYFRGKRRMVPVAGQARTDDTGEYRLISLEPGDYYVMGTTRDTWTMEGDEKQRVGFGPTYYSGTLAMASAQRIKVALGQEASGIDFGMVPGRVANISGIATTASGMPLAGESIEMSQEFAGPSYTSMFGFGGGKVNADGTFTIKDVPVGDYKLSVRWPGDAGRPAEGAAMTVSVTGADIEGISLVTGLGGSISGRVITDDGTSPALGGSALSSGRTDTRMRVSLRPQDPDSTYQRYTPDNGRVRDDGTFDLTDVMGVQRVSIAPLPSGWGIKAIEYNGKDYADAPLEVSNGQKLEGVTIVISNKLPTVRGVLKDDNARPSEGTVILFPEDASKWGESSRLIKTARPDPAGLFEIRMVPPGEYLIAAVDYVQNGAWDDPEYLKGLQEGATKATVQDAGTAAIALTLKK